MLTYRKKIFKLNGLTAAYSVGGMILLVMVLVRVFILKRRWSQKINLPSDAIPSAE
jgi:hypothetical protein